MNKVREIGSNKMAIAIIEENMKLKNWYSSLDFIHTDTKSMYLRIFVF